MKIRPFLHGWMALALIHAAVAQEPPSEPEVTLELIMSDPDWIGHAPQRPYWSDDSGTICFRQKVTGEDRHDLFSLDPDSGQVTRIEPAALPAAPAPAADYNVDRTLMVYERSGDLYLVDRATGSVRQLTRTTAWEGRPQFMADGRRIQFVRDGTILLRRIDDGFESQPAEVIAAASPQEKESREKKNYLQQQQERLFPHIPEKQRDARASREFNEEVRRQDVDRVPPPFYLGDDVRIQDTSLSPSGRWMLVVTTPPKREEGKSDTMPAYVDASGYVVTHRVREKVGTGKPWPQSLVLLDLESHEQHKIDLSVLPGIADDPLADLRRAAEDRKKAAAPADEAKEEDSDGQDTNEPDEPLQRGEHADQHGTANEGEQATAAQSADEPVDAAKDAAEPAAPREGKPRTISISSIRWNRDGQRLLVQCFSHDNKDRWIVEIDVESHAAHAIARVSDVAWVRSGALGWLNRRDAAWFVSEADGYDHLYLYDAATAETTQLTTGAFEVSEITLTHDDRHFYFKANVTHPGVYEVYRVAAETGEIERVTHLNGDCSYELSPDESRLALTYSNAAYPPELYVQDAVPGAPARRLTDTVSDAFKSIAWVHPTLVAVPSRHGRPIYARLYEPAEATDGNNGRAGGSQASPRRPAVMFVHGAGYLQNACEGWSYYFREFMFHTLLTRRGYVVLDMDYRASSGYGRDWRTAIYRDMGGPELEDLRDGVEWLVQEKNVDRDRVGVYGGSYGGFLTLMALFREPDLFACGAALRPVTDWAHYNDGYTSDILNTPDVDPQAYERSSPIEFAEGLSRPLLMCHGMLDGNVLFQDTVRLAQRLSELEKQDWEVAMYPIEGHSFDEPSSWLDEYRRVLKLFEENLRGHRP